jgi:hypothetical protein
VWCLVVLFLHWLGAVSACGGWGGDTSSCAYSRAKNGTYQGVLVAPTGAPLRNFAFAVSFDSRRHSSLRSVHGFTTDAQGGYCIVWADEHRVPYIDSVGDVRALWQPLNGRHPPPGCRSGNQGFRTSIEPAAMTNDGDALPPLESRTPSFGLDRQWQSISRI